ncbi:MAG TPA: hypothetical protein VFV70_06215 [Hyphomonadaceae bacterium]|nr:hypothetical protein [Hyphomonadaceae bacterium]
MSLILIGGALLGLLVLDAGPLTAESSKVVLPVATETAPATAESSEQHGFMTREISIDRTTGEPTEIKVIGFLD